MVINLIFELSIDGLKLQQVLEINIQFLFDFIKMYSALFTIYQQSIKKSKRLSSKIKMYV